MLPEYEGIFNQSIDGAFDSVNYPRPALFEHHGNRFVFASTETIFHLLSHISFTVTRHDEDDGSVTLSADALDIVSCGIDMQDARTALAKDILEYAVEYYQNYEVYSLAPNRKAHLPYVIKALAADSLEQLENAVVCRL